MIEQLPRHRQDSQLCNDGSTDLGCLGFFCASVVSAKAPPTNIRKVLACINVLYILCTMKKKFSYNLAHSYIQLANCCYSNSIWKCINVHGKCVYSYVKWLTQNDTGHGALSICATNMSILSGLFPIFHQ